jgi:Uma2 family endonuclease
MSQAIEKLLTYEEFTALSGEGRFELVNGRLEELVSPGPTHSWSETRIAMLLGAYLDEHDPGSFYGVELDIPTIPFFGRRPDFAYFRGSDVAAAVSFQHEAVTGTPTLVVEVVSSSDRRRDTVTKRSEYAVAGIAHYWLLDPSARAVLTLELQRGRFEVTGEFSGEETLTSDLFPGLEIPLSKLFR